MALWRIALVSIKWIVREITRQISWVMSISLENAIQNWLLSLTAYGWTEQRNLPSEYTQLDSITNANDWYIDTWIVADVDDMEFDIVATINSASNTSWYILQSRINASAYIYWISWSATGNTIIGAFSWTNIIVDNIVRSNWWKYHVNVKCKNGSITLTVEDLINETSETNTGTYTFTALTTNIWLFSNVSWGWTINNWNTSVHSAYIKKSWVKVFEYVPCKNSSNIAWMYDNISWTFLPATNTAQWWSMVAWSEVVPTPTAPMDIVSNNGVLKYSANMANVNAQTALVGYYISASGVVTASLQNWIYQDYIPVEPNTTYTITMSSPVYFVSISEYSTADDSGFIVRDASGSGTHTQFTITTSANTHFVRFGANIDGSSSVTLESVLAINWQLNKGNSMPYTPYIEGGVYTDGTVETINAHGKNLYNKADGVLFGYPSGNYTWIQKADNTAELTIMVKLKEGSTYTATRAENSVSIFRIQASSTSTLTDRQSLVDIDSTGTSTVTTKTFTVPYGAPYVLFYVRNTAAQSTLTVDDAINAFQVEEGSTATTYEPYFNGGTATAEMLLKVGNYIDEQSIIDGVNTRNVGIKVLDGTENWAFRNQSLSLFYATIADTYFNDSQANHLALSTHFLGVEVNNTNMPDNSCKCASLTGTNSLQVFVKSTNFAAPEDIKSWLASQYAAGTPVIVIYPLETPTTETVAGQTMNIQAWSNTIEITQASIDDLELSAEYKALQSN